MDTIKSSSKNTEINEEMSSEKKKQIEEFMSFEYFYNNLKNIDSEGVALFSKIIECLNKDVIKLKELTQVIQSKRFIPDQARGVIWRILLNYLPENRKYWINIIENNSKHYNQLVEEYIISRNKKNKGETQQSSNNEKFEDDLSINKINKQISLDSKPNEKQNNEKQNIDKQISIQQKMSKSTNLFENAATITLPIKNPLMKNTNNNNKILEIKEDCIDHPLNRKNTSSWNTHFKDLEIWELIEKDTKRTRADFYLQKNEQSRLYNGQIAKLFRKQQQNNDNLNRKISLNNLPNGNKTQENYRLSQQNLSSNQIAECEEYRYDVITRILFLYYKITPEDAKVKYVQGMNEIIGLIYQCFSQETSQYLREKAESDAFYCFCIVMTKIKAMFNFHQPEESSSALKSSSNFDSYKIYIDAFVELFKKADSQLFNYLAQLNIDPRLYLINWMVGFFCQNFDAQKAMQVWDCLFISNDIIEFIPYICVSILYINRDDLIVKQPSEIIMKLQNISDINLDKLMKMAFNLYNEFQPKMSAR